MTCRVDSTLIAGACVVGDRGLGVLGSIIRATTGPGSGPHGDGYLYNDWQAGDDGKEFRGLIVTPPSAGTFAAYEDGSFSLTGAPDGGYSFTYRLYVDGVDLGTSTASITIGAVAPPALTAAAAGLASCTATATGAVVALISSAPTTPQPEVIPTVSWDVWEPFVLPDADECPDTTMVFNVRQAAREFCRVTRVWQSSMTAILTDGVSTVFSMQGPADSEVGELLKVTLLREGYAAQDIEVVTPDAGIERMHADDLRPCAYSDGAGSLVVWPAQASGGQIIARAVLQPTHSSSVAPRFLFERHALDVAAGALGSILSMPGKPWTDLKTAAIHASQFAARKSTVTLVVRRGHARSTRTTATRWF